MAQVNRDEVRQAVALVLASRVDGFESFVDKCVELVQKVQDLPLELRDEIFAAIEADS